tara:strand:- start:425 stop:985 length:561 start_codon:yes stop_codon:yes gene_type:complete
MAKLRSIGVFCGSATGAKPDYVDGAKAAGRAVAQAGARLVYGGGDVGLMGAAAQAALDEDGPVLGIIPEFIIKHEGLLEKAETRIVTTMSTRKNMLINESDAFLILPGGVGTLEEIFDVLSRNRLGLQQKPVAFLNVDGFWDPMFTLLHRTEEEGFTPAGFAGEILIDTDPDDAVAHLMSALEGKE